MPHSNWLWLFSHKIIVSFYWQQNTCASHEHYKFNTLSCTRFDCPCSKNLSQSICGCVASFHFKCVSVIFPSMGQVLTCLPCTREKAWFLHTGCACAKYLFHGYTQLLHTIEWGEFLATVTLFPVGKSPGVTTEALGVCPMLHAQLLLFLYADGWLIFIWRTLW